MNSDKSKLFGLLGKNAGYSRPADIKELRDQFVRERLREFGYEPPDHTYIYQRPEWPTFSWNNEALARQVAQVHRKSELLLQQVGSTESDFCTDVFLEALAREAFYSSIIEGENLSKEQIRIAVAFRLGLEERDVAAHNVSGIVKMLYDAICNCRDPLTTTRLFSWHSGLFASGMSGLTRICVGSWRTNSTGPMRVVSGPVGREKVHYEAPAAEQLEAEMTAFLGWISNEDSTSLFLRAGIAHLWFVTIHPFEDGNGRIARAIAKMMLARSVHGPILFYSLSEQIFKERETYYRTLERAQRGTLDITDYLNWFLNCIDQAISAAYLMIENLKRKAYFQVAVFPKLNVRQRVVIGKVLNDFKGKLTQAKWIKLAKCTQDAAASDIDDLLTRGILVKDPCSSRAVSYSLAGVSNSNYREAMSRAAVDNEFIADTKEVEQDFATLDAEVTNSPDEDLPQYANKPTYGRDENGVFRFYQGGQKKYCREKRVQIPRRQHLNPPLSAIQTTLQKAIAHIHVNGMATVHCDKKGRAYLRHPDGRKEFCVPVITEPEADPDD